MKIRSFCESEELCLALDQQIGACLQTDAHHAHACFRMGLSGGSVLSFLRPGRWDLRGRRVKIYPIDERHVPLNHEDSNARQIQELVSQVFPSNLSVPGLHQGPVQAAVQTVAYPVELSLEGAAQVYEESLRADWQQPDAFPNIGFDFLLLGAGPDGHIASLFPGRPELNERRRWIVPVTDSPKPPPGRLTFTFPFLAQSRRAVLLLAGIRSKKAPLWERLKRQADDAPSLLPARRLMELMQDRIEIWTLP